MGGLGSVLVDLTQPPYLDKATREARFFFAMDRMERAIRSELENLSDLLTCGGVFHDITLGELIDLDAPTPSRFPGEVPFGAFDQAAE